MEYPDRCCWCGASILVYFPELETRVESVVCPRCGKKHNATLITKVTTEKYCQLDVAE